MVRTNTIRGKRNESREMTEGEERLAGQLEESFLELGKKSKHTTCSKELTHKGANYFRRRFRGNPLYSILGGRTRSEEDALSIVMGAGLARTQENAKRVLSFLDRRTIVLSAYTSFHIDQLINPKNEEISYRVEFKRGMD